jgi:peptidoglycan hydrolase CwlO-like protein
LRLTNEYNWALVIEDEQSTQATKDQLDDTDNAIKTITENKKQYEKELDKLQQGHESVTSYINEKTMEFKMYKLLNFHCFQYEWL